MQTFLRFHLYLVSLVIVFSSCDAFNTKVPSSEIKKATQWSSKDQFPSFPECEGMIGDELIACFSAVVSENVEAYLSAQELQANTPIETTIEVKLLVDKTGMITLDSFDDPDGIASLVTDFEAYLNEAIAGLPQAEAAVKTNVGTSVNVALKLPITIVAQPEE